jgi:hypothetical protein
MVDRKDLLTELARSKKDLVQLIVLPYLEMIDLVRMASLNKEWRKYFDPYKGY